MFRLALLLPLTFFLFSCGKNDPSASIKLVPGQVIVGQIDWLDIFDHKVPHEAAKNANAVALLDLPQMDSRCTGSLISKNVILTNEHCIPSSIYATGVTATFNFDSKHTKDRKKYSCQKFLGNNKSLDYALLECVGEPGLVQGILELDTIAPEIGDEIYVIHQNCDYYASASCDPTKKYSLGTLSDLSPELTYDADTLGGSSGSPVFSSSHKLIGLHHAGRPSTSNGRGIENYAVPMNLVFDSIKKNFPTVLGSSIVAPDVTKYHLREPNESIASATVLDLIRDKYYEELNVSSSSDLDFFKIQNTSFKTFTLKVSFKHSLGDLDVKIFNSKGLLIKSSTGSTDTETLRFYTSSDFFIQIYGYRGSTGAYSLSFE